MVEEGALPRPRVWGTRRIWRTAEIDAAMAEWPTDGQSDDEVAASNEWRADE
jgi:predicted DNA-binding transcriptional regulator AlpA